MAGAEHDTSALGATYNAELAASLEAAWQDRWEARETFRARTPEPDELAGTVGEKLFVLDMFPYPSGAGLHVGHPLGFIGTDVYARYQRARGRNVLHAMGFDSFGLPAEQYAVQTGTHPADTTERNVATYRSQLRRLGLAHDTSRSVLTSDPEFYGHTQWIFLQVYNAWFDEELQRARPISELVARYEEGLEPVPGERSWSDLTSKEQEAILAERRLAYRGESEVNWCPGLGTVLANEEVTSEGRSERGNFPVFRKHLTQWRMRITAYQERLERELEGLDWPESVKELQRNWMGEHQLRDGSTSAGLQDWLFSRQRYWGEPFPVVYDEDGGVHPLPESMLPLRLPEMASFAPDPLDPDDATSSPAAPLGRARDWVEVELDLGRGEGLRRYWRETSTMPQWAGSCWYFLRYLDPENSERFVDPRAEEYWMGPRAGAPAGGVDLYVGGVEHAVLHLLYARFWHKVLADLGHLSSQEPFHRLFNQGYVQAWAYEDERGVYVEASEVEEREGAFFFHDQPVTRKYGKMGKSLKNSVTPDEMCDEYGADTFRVYEMMAAPLDASRPWETRAVAGAHRLLQRVWRLLIDAQGNLRIGGEESDALARARHGVIRDVGEAYEGLRMNVAVARITELTNAATSECQSETPRVLAETVVQLLAPLAPHLCEELWERLGNAGSVTFAPWPRFDETLLVASEITYPVQVNGKARGQVTVAADAGEAEVLAAALDDPAITRYVGEASIRKTVFRPGKILNLVV